MAIVNARLLLLAFLALALPSCQADRASGGPKASLEHKTDTLSTAPGRSADRAQLAIADDDDSDEPVSVLIVNDETITVEQVLQPLRKQLAEHARADRPDQYQRYLAELLPSRVRQLAREALLYQIASKDLTDRENEELEKIVDQRLRERVNEEFAGRQTRYERALAEQGLSLAQDRDRQRRDLVVRRWLQLNVVDHVVDPTRQELWTLFENQKDTLATPPRRQMLLIEIPVLSELPAGVTAPDPNQLAEAKQAARAKAQAAREALRAGTPFADIARAHSRDAHARDGGQWGWLRRGTVQPRWEPAVEALFSLPEINVPSEVLETPDAFFIVQAAAIETGRQPDFESLQPELLDRYRNDRFNERIENRVTQLFASAQIRPKNLNRFLRAVLAAAPQATGSPR